MFVCSPDVVCYWHANCRTPFALNFSHAVTMRPTGCSFNSGVHKLMDVHRQRKSKTGPLLTDPRTGGRGYFEGTESISDVGFYKGVHFTHFLLVCNWLSWGVHASVYTEFTEFSVHASVCTVHSP